MVFLGRPRTPRTAVAEDAPRPVRLVLVGLAASIAVLGLLPALALLPAAGWTGSPAFAGVLVLRTGAETPGYSPIARGWAARGGRDRRHAGIAPPAGAASGASLPGPAASPRRRAWLPFGDPATQYSPASFVEPLQRVVALLPPMATIRHRLVRWSRGGAAGGHRARGVMTLLAGLAAQLLHIALMAAAAPTLIGVAAGCRRGSPAARVRRCCSHGGT